MKSYLVSLLAAVFFLVFVNCNPVADTKDDVIDGLNAVGGTAGIVAAGAGATGEN